MRRSEIRWLRCSLLSVRLPYFVNNGNREHIFLYESTFEENRKLYHK
nr:MAG TPA: hypothetical protein [Caudoviricetes sp.]